MWSCLRNVGNEFHLYSHIDYFKPQLTNKSMICQTVNILMSIQYFFPSPTVHVFKMKNIKMMYLAICVISNILHQIECLGGK